MIGFNVVQTSEAYFRAFLQKINKKQNKKQKTRNKKQRTKITKNKKTKNKTSVNYHEYLFVLCFKGFVVFVLGLIKR